MEAIKYVTNKNYNVSYTTHNSKPPYFLNVFHGDIKDVDNMPFDTLEEAQNYAFKHKYLKEGGKKWKQK